MTNAMAFPVGRLTNAPDYVFTATDSQYTAKDGRTRGRSQKLYPVGGSFVVPVGDATVGTAVIRSARKKFEGEKKDRVPLDELTKYLAQRRSEYRGTREPANFLIVGAESDGIKIIQAPENEPQEIVEQSFMGEGSEAIFDAMRTEERRGLEHTAIDLPEGFLTLYTLASYSWRMTTVDTAWQIGLLRKDGRMRTTFHSGVPLDTDEERRYVEMNLGETNPEDLRERKILLDGFYRKLTHAAGIFHKTDAACIRAAGRHTRYPNEHREALLKAYHEQIKVRDAEEELVSKMLSLWVDGGTKNITEALELYHKRIMHPHKKGLLERLL